MGQGEPLANLDEVEQACRVLSHPCGGRIQAGLISISTVGIVPRIREFTARRLPYRLIVSLTSTVQERRAALLPVAAAWPVEEVAAAIREYAAAARGRVTVAWVLLGGVNHGPEEVEGIRRLLGDVPLRLNLIDVNDPRPDGFRQATPDELAGFRTRLRELGVPVVRRYSGGVATHAACGMLASRARTA
jgi:23S rRNA (adenine2503-C2)-methyltransferase